MSLFAETDLQRLEHCLNPRHIALVGGREVEKVLTQCRKMDYQGDIWVVNPHRKEIGGLPCYADISECPVVADATFIAIPATPTVELVKYLSRNGHGGAVCYASGFGETIGKGKQLQEKLIENAANMPLLGPNCHGFINALSGAALWPDQHGLNKVNQGVAIISSSGNVGINMSLQQRALPIALLATVGNQAVMGVEQIIRYAIHNDNITALGLHLEGLVDLPLFIALMNEAKRVGMPVVVLKTGKSTIGSRITMSHTATLAGESLLYDALFERLAVAQVSTVEEFIETLKFLSINGVISGNQIASMSCSGGEASLIADLSASKDIIFAKLTKPHQQRIQQTLNEYVNIDNPLDYHTFIWGDYDKLLATFSAMLEGQFDLTLLILDFPVIKGCDHTEYLTALNAFIAAAQQQPQPVAVVVSLPESIDQAIMQKLVDNGITPFLGFTQALVAIEASYHIYQGWKDNHTDLSIIKNPKYKADSDCKTCNESDAKALLKDADCQTPKAWLVTKNNYLSFLNQADKPFPLVAKAVDESIQHKTEIGAVVLDINSAESLTEHIHQLLTISSQVLVEKMIKDVVAELLVCVSYDQQFGYYLVVGMGGTWAEIYKDRQIVLLPATEKEIVCALNRLKIAPILNGYRGQPAVAVAPIIDTITRIIDLVLNQHADILEVEVNPLLVTQRESWVADALITQIAD